VYIQGEVQEGKLASSNRQWTTRKELQENTILRGRSYFYDVYNPTPFLSIKTMRNGRALYDIDGGRFAVDDNTYLILNELHPYRIFIDSNTIVESFCVFFPMGWAEDIYRSVTVPPEQMLSEPQAKDFQSWGFFERLQSHDEVVSPVVWRIQTALHEDAITMGWLEDNLRLLLMRMMHVQFTLYREVEQMPLARHATRLELYRRLHLARDYIHANLNRPLNLEEIAGVAHLSPYHFLRTYKQIFGQTPHKYLTQQRLERARFLLSQTRQSITDICFEIGFESLGSFSTLFQRRVGLSPRRYRQQAVS
jgi:AraC-like DNA-binding protein